ncbi:MAG: hypothetical protein AAF490_27660 [Chloroflexota bacterium]
MKYTLKPKIIALCLGGLATLFACQSLLSEFLLLNVLTPDSDSFAVLLIDLLSVNVEESIPTWFSTMLLFMASLLLWFIWGVKKRKADEWMTYWLGLAIIFLYLSVDEGAAIHEAFVGPIEALVDTSGFLAFAWQIVFFPLVVLFAIVYSRFLRALPRETAVFFILSGVIYVGGAVFIEGLSANEWDLNQGITFRYLMIATFEEWFEMLGATLFIYTLLDYIVLGNYTAVFDFFPTSATNGEIFAWPQTEALLKGTLYAVLGLNLVLFLWVFQNPATDSVVEKRPLSEQVVADYGEESIVILQLNESVTPAKASALLTLFDDVVVINESATQTTTVFAGATLPFDTPQLLQQYGDHVTDSTVVMSRADLTQLAVNP